MTETADEVSVEGLRRVAEQVAVEAAELVRRRRAEGVEVVARKSSVIDIVTQVDRESEAFLRSRLAELRPDDGFLGEEGGAREARSGVTWVVDPIDGTVNFLYGIPHYAVSVAAVDPTMRSLAGAVVHVPTGEVFTASRGGGATCDGRPIRVRVENSMEQRLVLTGFQYQQHVRVVQAAATARLLGRVRDIRRLGSAALDLCAVAAGRADVYVEEGLMLWDRAAAGLIAEEAGAVVEVFRGAGGMDGVLCAPAETYVEVAALVVECGFLGAETGAGSRESADPS